MAYTLEQLSDDIRTALKADPGVGGKQAVVKLVSKVLRDKDFIDKHLRAEDCKPRKVLYEDPELGFCVCGHVYEKPSLVERERTYVLKPGDAHFYDVGVVHSPKRDGLTKLVRIEGANLDRIKRSNIKAAAKVDA
jgi:hypothetical protein